MEKDKKALYVFDVCGTLYHANTTYAFLTFYFKKESWPKYVICRLLLSNPSKVILVLLNRIGIVLELRSFLISLLKEQEKSKVENLAQEFVSKKLDLLRNQIIHKALLEALATGEKVVLVSASIEPVVKAIAYHLQVEDWYSTVLGITNEQIYTGEIRRDFKGKKLNVLKEHFNLKDYNLVVFTDNFEDLPLIKESDYSQVISKPRSVVKWRRMLEKVPQAKIVHV